MGVVIIYQDLKGVIWESGGYFTQDNPFIFQRIKAFGDTGQWSDREITEQEAKDAAMGKIVWHHRRTNHATTRFRLGALDT